MVQKASKSQKKTLFISAKFSKMANSQTLIPRKINFAKIIPFEEYLKIIINLPTKF